MFAGAILEGAEFCVNDIAGLIAAKSDMANRLALLSAYVSNTLPCESSRGTDAAKLRMQLARTLQDDFAALSAQTNTPTGLARLKVAVGETWQMGLVPLLVQLTHDETLFRTLAAHWTPEAGLEGAAGLESMCSAFDKAHDAGSTREKDLILALAPWSGAGVQARAAYGTLAKTSATVVDGYDLKREEGLRKLIGTSSCTEFVNKVAQALDSQGQKVSRGRIASVYLRSRILDNAWKNSGLLTSISPQLGEGALPITLRMALPASCAPGLVQSGQSCSQDVERRAAFIQNDPLLATALLRAVFIPSHDDTQGVKDVGQTMRSAVQRWARWKSGVEEVFPGRWSELLSFLEKATDLHEEESRGRGRRVLFADMAASKTVGNQEAFLIGVPEIIRAQGQLSRYVAPAARLALATSLAALIASGDVSLTVLENIALASALEVPFYAASALHLKFSRIVADVDPNPHIVALMLAYEARTQALLNGSARISLAASTWDSFVPDYAPVAAALGQRLSTPEMISFFPHDTEWLFASAEAVTEFVKNDSYLQVGSSMLRRRGLVDQIILQTESDRVPVSMSFELGIAENGLIPFLAELGDDPNISLPKQFVWNFSRTINGNPLPNISEGLLATSWGLLHLPNLDLSRQFYVSALPTDEQALRLALVNLSDVDLEVYEGPSAEKIFYKILGRGDHRADFEKFRKLAAWMSDASGSLYAKQFRVDDGTSPTDAAARITKKILNLGTDRPRFEVMTDPLDIENFRLMARGATWNR